MLEGVTSQELIGTSHDTSMTVAAAAKEFLARYAEIALGAQRKLPGMSQWLVAEQLDEATGE
jgi:hypothetical protein